MGRAEIQGTAPHPAVPDAAGNREARQGLWAGWIAKELPVAEIAQHAGNQSCWTKHVTKAWGRELWLVNNEKYCAKFLYLESGQQCSLHRHFVKDETFYVLSGSCRLEFGDAVQVLEAGDTRRIYPGTFHRFSNRSEHICVILEVSTFHSDDDVERLEPSQPIS